MNPLCSARGLSVLLSLTALLGAETAGDPITRPVLERISADSLRGHVSFLASDLLEGRATPSRGQDIAAEYIAAQFRRAGLEPLGDQGYFQTARFVSLETDPSGAAIELVSADKHVAADLEQTAIDATAALALNGAPVVKMSVSDLAAAQAMKPEDAAGRVIAVHMTRVFGPEAARRYEILQAIRRLSPAVLLITGPGAPRQQRTRLLDADEVEQRVPVIGVRDGEFATLVEQAADGLLEWKIDVRTEAPKRTDVTLKNVAAIVRGSDPALKDTYVLLSGHYDHVGTKLSGDGDRIFNGANDDASGAASVMEIASALATMNPRPKRSVVFLALFGEELGLLGARYYGKHPLVPVSKTIANVNLEHMGRTDSNDGPKLASASFTGFDFSDVPAVFQEAGRQLGIEVYKDEKRSDAFFAASDNQALADLGVPAHTLCVAFEFPDYHGVGDEWQKIDYENMAKVDRMVALGLLQLANSEAVPKWSADNPKVKKYADAAKALKAEAGQ